MTSNRTFSVCLAALPLLLLASCAGQPAPSTQDTKAELCTNLARFDTAVATLKSMSPSSTVSDLKNARDQVEVTFTAVRNSAGAVQDAKSQDLERAYAELDKAVTNVPNTATLNQAATSIAPQVAAVQAAEAQMEAQLNCP